MKVTELEVNILEFSLLALRVIWCVCLDACCGWRVRGPEADFWKWYFFWKNYDTDFYLNRQLDKKSGRKEKCLLFRHMMVLLVLYVDEAWHVRFYAKDIHLGRWYYWKLLKFRFFTRLIFIAIFLEYDNEWRRKVL